VSAEDRKRAAWVKKHRDDPDVLLWLSKNKPPKEWEGSSAEYAYTEMPQSEKGTWVIVGLGLLGLAVGAAWYMNRVPRQQAPLIAGQNQGAPLVRVPRQRYGA
jgi:hypothetical protein